MLVWRGLTPSEGPTGALLSLLFFFFLIPILSGHRGARAHKLTPMRGSIVSGGLCYSRLDAGVSGPDKRQGHSLFTVGSFMAPVKQEPLAEVGGARGATVGPPLFVLSQASTIGQRARGGMGRRGYRPDFCLCDGGGGQKRCWWSWRGK